MSLTALMASGPVIASGGEEFTGPTPGDFYQPMWDLGFIEITRPMLVLALVTVLACWIMLAGSRNASVVPSKGQFYFEQVYDFVRGGIARDMIGPNYRKYMPLLFGLFLFVLLSNLMASTPFIQNPPTARIAIPIVATAVVYVAYHYVGIKKHGLAGYFKFMVPKGLSPAMVPAIFVLEAATYFLIRPLTLALRLFGNLFAGHMLILVFVLGGEFLLFHDNWLFKFFSIGAFGMGFLMQVFEILIQALQAYVFTLLAASYIGTAEADEH